MSEVIQNKTVFSLFEVASSIQKTLTERYQNAFWVKAEMNKLNYYNHSGHCYPELVEKKDGKVIAQMRSNLWKNDYIQINNAFLNVLKEPLKDGIKILFLAKISFDPSYGLALQILDIDPAFTLGDLEQEKTATIQKLKEEGIFDLNKTLSLPLLPKRIAIISVESSKGYADFMDVIDSNPWGYRFFTMLFPSMLQGEKAVSNIIQQLRSIKKVKQHFDMVAIIRGGGGDIGLACYNHYDLAKEIAEFPLPVLTGIGHSTNETVAEMISFSNAITPTKLAEYLLQLFHNFSVPVSQAIEKITEKARRILSDETKQVDTISKLFASATRNHLQNGHNQLNYISQGIAVQSKFIVKSNLTQNLNMQERLSAACNAIFKTGIQKIEQLESNVKNMDPVNVLKRGFSITMLNGKAVTNIEDVEIDTILQTQVLGGLIESKVSKTIKNHE